MRVVEAARLVSTGQLSKTILWQMTTTPEQVVIALLLGRPEWLPQKAATPTTAWQALDTRYRTLLLRRAPATVRACLPGLVRATLPHKGPDPDDARLSS